MDGIDYSTLADRYARHRRVHPKVLARLMSGLDAAARVLEVGCGTGNYIAEIHELVGCDCVGEDPSPEMLANLSARSPLVRALEASAEQLDLHAESFHLVFSVDVIHHVVDRASAFREAFRVLRDGGRICTVTDSEWVIRHREPLSVYFPETVEVDLARYPSLETLRTEMTVAGFRSLREELVEHSYRLTEAKAYREKVYSALHGAGEEAFQRGLARLESDLRRGPIPCTSRYCLLWGSKPLPD